MSSKPVVGLIGVGLMGHGIARNVAKKGFALHVLEHPGNQPLDELRSLGAQTCQTPAQLAAAPEDVADGRQVSVADLRSGAFDGAEERGILDGGDLDGFGDAV